jgi:hypothetical protein
MKQILLTTAIFLMVASTKNSSAQSANDVTLNLSGIISSLKLSAVEAKATEVNVRAMRNFNRTYKNAPEAKWFKSDKGYFASFSADGKNTKIIYDGKGRRNYTIISYPEAKLDREVRTQVKSVYFDATIIGVHQFEFDDKTIHVIKMLDQNSKPMTLKVYEGQLEDITSHDNK